eukprot:gene3980-4949_t
MRWDSSPTKYAPPQRRNGKELVNPLTGVAGGDKDDDEAKPESGGGGDHDNDHPDPGEQAHPSGPRSVAPEDSVQDHIYALCVDYDSASRAIAQRACTYLTEWRTLTAHSTLDEFRESETKQYMEDGLEAVVAVYSSRWYREILHAAAEPPQLSRSMAAGPSNAMYTVDPRSIKNEKSQLKDVRKLR